MGTETINGKDYGRCQCGTLYTLDNRQDACDENGERYIDIIANLKKDNKPLLGIEDVSTEQWATAEKSLPVEWIEKIVEDCNVMNVGTAREASLHSFNEWVKIMEEWWEIHSFGRFRDFDILSMVEWYDEDLERLFQYKNK